MKQYYGLFLVAGVLCSQAVLARSDFKEMVADLEASGGRDNELEAEVCGKAQQLRDDIRDEALDTIPELHGLRVRMAEVQDGLARVGTQLNDANSRLKRLQKAPANDKVARADLRALKKAIKQLKSDQRAWHWKMTEIEREIQARLLSKPELADPYERVGKVQQRWCN